MKIYMYGKYGILKYHNSESRSGRENIFAALDLHLKVQ